MASQSLVLAAPAKINLTLEVLGRRPDGYHELRSVMQAITLADRLTFKAAAGLTLHCSDPALAGQANLVWRAASLLRESAGTSQGAEISLEKRIPVAAGLGGGSSDAATTLLGLNHLWRLGLSREALRHLGARLGSDVPFFLGTSATALAEGRGERLTPLPLLPHRWLVLVKPPLSIATADVYRAFPTSQWSDGRRTTAWLAAAAGGVLPPPFDDLEPVALDLAPAAARARADLEAAGARQAVMSGSGPTFYALFEGEAAARAVLARLDRRTGQVDPPAGAAVQLAGFGSLTDPDAPLAPPPAAAPGAC